MAAKHPIGDDLLMGYATGRLTPAQDLFVAAAVSLDDGARVRLNAFEAMGGALLARGEVAPLRSDSFEAVIARIRRTVPEETVSETAKVPRRNPVLPRPLRDVAGGDVGDLRWRDADDDAAVVALMRDGGGRATLYRLDEGRALSAGAARTLDGILVLAGAAYLGGRRLERGDALTAAEGLETPRADAGAALILLGVGASDAAARGVSRGYGESVRCI